MKNKLLKMITNYELKIINMKVLHTKYLQILQYNYMYMYYPHPLSLSLSLSLSPSFSFSVSLYVGLICLSLSPFLSLSVCLSLSLSLSLLPSITAYCVQCQLPGLQQVWHQESRLHPFWSHDLVPPPHQS